MLATLVERPVEEWIFERYVVDGEVVAFDGNLTSFERLERRSGLSDRDEITATGVAAKWAASPYRSGRSRDWPKLKCVARQELVIGGFTEPKGGRDSLGAPDDGDVHWVDPDLVCEVGFTEWTRAGRLRHPRYLGLRDDKATDDVTIELPEDNR